jgi:hypothetical protein
MTRFPAHGWYPAWPAVLRSSCGQTTKDPVAGAAIRSLSCYFFSSPDRI